MHSQTGKNAMTAVGCSEFVHLAYLYHSGQHVNNKTASLRVWNANRDVNCRLTGMNYLIAGKDIIIYCTTLLCMVYAVSVCMHVCLSHAGIVSKCGKRMITQRTTHYSTGIVFWCQNCQRMTEMANLNRTGVCNIVIDLEFWK